MSLLSKLNLVRKADYDDLEEKSIKLLKRISVVTDERNSAYADRIKELEFNEYLMEKNDSFSLELFKYKCGIPVMLFAGCAIGYFLR